MSDVQIENILLNLIEEINISLKECFDRKLLVQDILAANQYVTLSNTNDQNSLDLLNNVLIKLEANGSIDSEMKKLILSSIAKIMKDRWLFDNECLRILKEKN